MIKRQYFISVKKARGDGSGSYSYFHSQFSFSSWRENSQLAFEEAYKTAKSELGETPGGTIEVVSFSRL